MIDVIGYTLDFLISLAFFIWGYYLGKRHKTEPKEKDASVCSCDHEYSKHKDNGTCNVVIKKYAQYEWHTSHCPCVRYDGIPPAHIYMRDV